jgi:hypothetical protein
MLPLLELSGGHHAITSAQRSVEVAVGSSISAGMSGYCWQWQITMSVAAS